MNYRGDSRALRCIKNAANQRKRHQDPARREAEHVADTARRRIAREQPGRREEEQEADTARRRIAREQPGRRDEENEQRRIAREQPGRRDEENNGVQGMSNQGCWNTRQYNVHCKERNQEEERKSR